MEKMTTRAALYRAYLFSPVSGSTQITAKLPVA